MILKETAAPKPMAATAAPSVEPVVEGQQKPSLKLASKTRSLDFTAA